MPDDLIPLYTIGYGQRTLEEFLAVLRRYEIAFLVDVRTAPYSRFKPEFARESLDAALTAMGIRYVFMGDSLGGRPADPECYSDGKVDYEKVKEKDFYRGGIGRLQTAFAQQRRLALMCSEGKPEACHRSLLIGVSLTDLGIPVIHLDENDDPQSQAAVIGRRTAGQLSLFGAPTFTSRKRYLTDDDE